MLFAGEDFDQRIMEYFIKLIKRKYNKDISKDNRALGKLRREAERAKRALSNQHQVSFDANYPRGNVLQYAKPPLLVETCCQASIWHLPPPKEKRIIQCYRDSAMGNEKATRA
jgi:hypothetical protein